MEELLASNECDGDSIFTRFRSDGAEKCDEKCIFYCFPPSFGEIRQNKFSFALNRRGVYIGYVS